MEVKEGSPGRGGGGGGGGGMYWPAIDNPFSMMYTAKIKERCSLFVTRT